MNKSFNQLAVHRLTGLWAFSEAGLGGFLHAFKSPFTGLILCSISVSLICLIYYYGERKSKTVFRSLLLVLLIKIMVSPHAMITAYFAVLFQGLFAIFILSILKLNTWSIGVIAIGCLLESALQKIISLTIIFGKSIWQAIDGFGEWLIAKFSIILPIASSKALITIYLGLYLLAGILLTFFISNLIKKIKNQNQFEEFQIFLDLQSKKVLAPGAKKSNKKWQFVLVVFCLAILIGITLMGLNEGTWSNAFYVLFRAAAILIIWFGFIAPLLLKWLKKYIVKTESAFGNELNQTLDLFPYFHNIKTEAWKKVNHLFGIRKIRAFLFYILMYTLHFKKVET